MRFFSLFPVPAKKTQAVDVKPVTYLQLVSFEVLQHLKKCQTLIKFLINCFFFQFRYATGYEIFLIILGVILATILSTSMAVMTILYGEFTALLIAREVGDERIHIWLLKWFGGGRHIG